VTLDRIARDVLADLETRVGESGGTVEIGKLPTVQGDATQMRQLLQNLIANALKFHRDGVPPVVRVDQATTTEPGMVALTVADNGIGFESTYEERIFRVFERLHPRDVYAGTGIGLALCRKIAERHGGTITGDGRPGEGATFTVVLPAAVSMNGNAPSTPARPPVHA
jgi:light-regulated signal transduction histidine kinase (bacteriophytochrome)